LLNVAVSRLLDRAPGCSPLVIRWILRVRALNRGIRVALKEPLHEQPPPPSPDRPAGSVSHGEGGSDSGGVR
jgi:hypothetical protein